MIEIDWIFIILVAGMGLGIAVIIFDVGIQTLKWFRDIFRGKGY